jgi:hypothetical protein
VDWGKARLRLVGWRINGLTGRLTGAACEEGKNLFFFNHLSKNTIISGKNTYGCHKNIKLFLEID